MNNSRRFCYGRLRLGIAILSAIAALSISACAPAQSPAATATVTQPAATEAASPTPSAGATKQVAESTTTVTPLATETPLAAEATVAPSDAAQPSPATDPEPTATAPVPAASTEAPPATPTTPPAPTVTPVPVTASVAVNRQVGAELAGGELVGLALNAAGDALVPDAASSVASVTSAPQENAFAFDNLVLSWAASVPDDASLRALVRVRAGDEWSPWYTMGLWENGRGSSVRGQSDAWGRVDVDTLQLARAADGWQYRIEISAGTGQELPALRSVTVALKDTTRPPQGPQVALADGWARELDVPSESQAIQDPAVAWEICSPTSLTMILRSWGVETTVPEVYRGVRDATTGIYGNWPLNTAYAAQQGFDAYVARFYSLDQLRNEIAAGRPVAISIRFSAGELPGSPLNSTNGHLIVVRGFTADGKVIVNDPAAPNREQVRRVLNAADLEKVWLRSGGIAYVVIPL